MRNFIVIWDSGVDNTAFGPWTTEEAADQFIDKKAHETWEQLFDEKAPSGEQFYSYLERQSGNKFTIIPVIPPCEQPNAEDAFDLT